MNRINIKKKLLPKYLNKNSFYISDNINKIKIESIKKVQKNKLNDSFNWKKDDIYKSFNSFIK